MVRLAVHARQDGRKRALRRTDVTTSPRARGDRTGSRRIFPTKNIGRCLNLHEKTITHHMTEILFKLGASDRTEAAIRWRQGA
ncbi:LuxR C-terminal-related transcriptional regulator [Rhizobium sp. F40D2]|uniref:LuxR C-terminal-related transcriptional regulator n=1 Tax=Rhizobium sp. F40D2 TaxID=3453141 RepID=UPI003F278799